MACGCNQIRPVGQADPAAQKYEAKTHIYGVGTVILGAALPLVLYYLSDKAKLTQTDRYVLKGLAVTSGLIIAPLGLMYLRGLNK